MSPEDKVEMSHSVSAERHRSLLREATIAPHVLPRAPSLHVLDDDDAGDDPRESGRDRLFTPVSNAGVTYDMVHETAADWAAHGAHAEDGGAGEGHEAGGVGEGVAGGDGSVWSAWVWETVWTFAWAMCAATIVFWIPQMHIESWTLNNFLYNVTGAMVMAVVTQFSQVKFQYRQTYLMYAGIGGGFCSALTTFGNLIEDTQNLAVSHYAFLSPVNLFGTLLVAFPLYQLGRFLAIRWKSSTLFAYKMMQLDHEDHRMVHEVDVADLREELRRSTNVPSKAQADELRKRLSAKQRHISASTMSDGGRRMLRDEVGTPFSLQEVHLHLRMQQEKAERHDTLQLQRRHKIILGVLASMPVLTYVLIAALPRGYIPKTRLEINHPYYTYGTAVVLSVAGAFVGGFWGSVNISRNEVQWGTFRVNLTSCVLIAIAHNILEFRFNFPLGHTKRFVIFWQHFISNFCGTESSFAGLIDETTTLWNSADASRKTALRNLVYNLFLGQAVYLVASFTIRFAVINMYGA